MLKKCDKSNVNFLFKNIIFCSVHLIVSFVLILKFNQYLSGFVNYVVWFILYMAVNFFFYGILLLLAFKRSIHKYINYKTILTKYYIKIFLVNITIFIMTTHLIYNFSDAGLGTGRTYSFIGILIYFFWLSTFNFILQGSSYADSFKILVKNISRYIPVFLIHLVTIIIIFILCTSVFNTTNSFLLKSVYLVLLVSIINTYTITILVRTTNIKKDDNLLPND